MPRKGHKTAARQAQLQKRRKRGSSKPQSFDAGPSEDEILSRQAIEEEQSEAGLTGSITSKSVLRPPITKTIPGKEPLSQPRILPEVTRIGILSSLMVVILVVLTLVLG